MFTVTGFTAGVPYDVAVHDNGSVVGSEDIERLLLRHEGRHFSETPTSTSVPLDPADPASILLALRSLTRVSLVTGDVLPEAPDDEPDADEARPGETLLVTQ